MIRRFTKPHRDPVFVRMGERGDISGGQVAGQIVLVPGAEVPLLPVNLPDKLRGRPREQVAWRQLRGQIGVSEGQGEMRAFGATKAAQWSRVLVVDGGVMQGWRRAAGKSCGAILPDYLGLPAAEDLWVVSVDAMGLRVRLGLSDGFSAEPDLAQLMLGQLLAIAKGAVVPDKNPNAAKPDMPDNKPKTERPHKSGSLYWSGGPPKAALLLGDQLQWVDDMFGDAGIPVARSIAEVPRLRLGIDAPVLLGHAELAADLRVDAGAARDRMRQRMSPWRWPILAAMVAIGVWSVDQHLDIRRIDAWNEGVRLETDTLVREHFVPSGPLLDVRLQVSQALAALRVDANQDATHVSALAFLRQVSDVLANTQAETQQIVFGRETGWELDLRLADFAAVDQLVLAFKQAQVLVDLRETRASEKDGISVVRARMGVSLMPDQNR
jgi:general secretion pathway protein L